MPESAWSHDLPKAYQGKMEELYWSPEIMQGAIPVCHAGCGRYYWIVVNGPLAGDVWEDGRSSDGGVAPLLTTQGKRIDFEGWYADWLRQALVHSGLSFAETL